ncbi:MAG: 50S ribosomal protein L30 [Acidimicrobiales bacterium]
MAAPRTKKTEPESETEAPAPRTKKAEPGSHPAAPAPRAKKAPAPAPRAEAPSPSASKAPEPAPKVEGRLHVTQIRSAIGSKPKHRGTLRALGLGRIGQSNDLPDRPEIRGMLARVPHMITVSEAKTA